MLDVMRTSGPGFRPLSAEVVRADPFRYLDFELESLRGLAALMERLADSLPDDVNRSEAAVGSALLHVMAAQRVAPVEDILFPALERCLPEDAPARRALMVARSEHETTTGAAIGLAEELDMLSRTGRARNPDALGFMLHAFFDAARRQADWIEAAILTHARVTLGPAETALLGEQLAAHAIDQVAQRSNVLRTIGRERR